MGVGPRACLRCAESIRYLGKVKFPIDRRLLDDKSETYEENYIMRS